MDGDKVEEKQTVIKGARGKSIKATGKGMIKIDKEKEEARIIYNKKEEKTYDIEPGMELMVQDGDNVKAGEQITEGHVDLHQLLKIKEMEK